jgi:hypothetical protein
LRKLEEEAAEIQIPKKKASKIKVKKGTYKRPKNKAAKQVTTEMLEVQEEEVEEDNPDPDEFAEEDVAEIKGKMYVDEDDDISGPATPREHASEAEVVFDCLALESRVREKFLGLH